jgi:hypothetical protein
VPGPAQRYGYGGYSLKGRHGALGDGLLGRM